MSELPKCSLCGEETEEILASSFKPRHKVNYVCPLSKVVFTRDQWQQLMGGGEPVLKARELISSPQPERAQYSRPVCRGSWALGSACGKCERCEHTKPEQAQQSDVVTALENLISTIRFAPNGVATIKAIQAGDEAIAAFRDEPRPVPTRPTGKTMWTETMPDRRKQQRTIPTSERLPTKEDSDYAGYVFAFTAFTKEWVFQHWMHIAACPKAYTHWQPTGLQRPTVPTEAGECCCGETEQSWRLCPQHGNKKGNGDGR